MTKPRQKFMVKRRQAQRGLRVTTLSVGSKIAVPFDVICLVMQHLDQSDLRMLGSSNHECSREADKRLWRTASIFTGRNRAYPAEPGPVSIEEQCEAIIRNPERAARIRALFIGIRAPLDPQLPKGKLPMADIMAKIRQALFCSPNLLSLRIDSLYHAAEIAEILSFGPPFPFRLKVFSSRLRRESGLEPFFASQPSITHYENDLPMRTSFPALTHLPALNYVRAPAINIFYAIRDRPISSLDISPGFADPVLLQAILTAPSIPIDSLRLELAGDVYIILGLIAPLVPHLRSLGFYHSDSVASVFSKLGAKFTALENFPELEEFEWWVEAREMREMRIPKSSSSVGVVNACIRACPTLRRMVFAFNASFDFGDGDVCVRVYEPPAGWASKVGDNFDIKEEGWTVRHGMRKHTGLCAASEYLSSSWGVKYTDMLSHPKAIGHNPW